MMSLLLNTGLVERAALDGRNFVQQRRKPPGGDQQHSRFLEIEAGKFRTKTAVMNSLQLLEKVVLLLSFWAPAQEK